MSGGTTALRVPRLGAALLGGGAPWLPKWSRAAALRALRTTIVMPTLLALTIEVIGNLQMALFAGFGSFATLVLVAFNGTRREKLLAHLGLALGGSVVLVIGTAVSSSTALAAVVTVPVAFGVFFSGIAGPNAASRVTGLLLAYVLPAASAGTVGVIPDRLAGWWMASIAGTAAVLLIAAPSAGDRVRPTIGRLATTIADAVEAALGGTGARAASADAITARDELVAVFNATPLRPTGLAATDHALANAVELLEWCASLVGDMIGERGAPAAERDLLAAAADVLRDSGALLVDGRTRPDLDRLDAARRRSSREEGGAAPGSPAFTQHAQLAFHAHTIATTALAVGAEALVAARLADADWRAAARTRWFTDPTAAAPAQRRTRRAAARRAAGTAARHAHVRSVWFVNSLRGALALAAAVAVADVTTVQHGFWVVLGTLSVLRTNAAATGATALRALLGTVAGFAIGAGLLIMIGTDTSALWAVLPVAVAVAAYSPGTAPFVIGQAAFTVTVVVLFNLLVPVGWKVGELRVEDVALGCGVSLLVGLLFWPRGVAPLVADDLAAAYRTGAAYLREAVEWVSRFRAQPPAGSRAAASGGRLDEALHAFIAEQGTKHISLEELWRLVGGTVRLRLAAHAIAGLPPTCRLNATAACGAIVQRVTDLEAWYGALASEIGRPQGPLIADLAPPPRPAPAPASAAAPESRDAIWLNEHLDHLTDHLDAIVAPAARLADIRRRPWWR